MLGRPALCVAALVLVAMHSGQCQGHRIFPQKAPQLGLSNIRAAISDIKSWLGVETVAATHNVSDLGIFAIDSAPAGALELQDEATNKGVEIVKQHQQWTVAAISDHVVKTSAEGPPSAVVHSRRRLRQIPAAPAAG